MIPQKNNAAEAPGPRKPSGLGKEIDASDRVERQKAVRGLLLQPLLPAVGPTADLYALVRRHSAWLIDWFGRHPQWPLLVTPEVARLRKIPATFNDATRPAFDVKNQQAFNRRRYTMLCLALAALERADRQITLARLAENILASAQVLPAWKSAGWPFELGNADGRRDLVHVVRLLIGWQVLRRLDGDEENLIRSADANALYTIQRPLLANLLAGRNPSFIAAMELDGRLAGLSDSGPSDTDEARNEQIRTSLYRRLLDDPVVYYDTLSESERFYCDRQRPTLLQRLEEATGLIPEVRAEGIALVDDTDESSDLRLPEQGTYGHATLLVATHFAQLLRAQPATGGPVRIAVSQVEDLVAGFAQTHKRYWKAESTLPGAHVQLTAKVLERLAALGLVAASTGHVEPRAAIGRFALIPPAVAEPASSPQHDLA